MDQKCNRGVVVTLLVTISLMFSVIHQANASDIKDEDVRLRLENGARKEGKVAFYGSMTVEDAMPMIRIFESKYPYLKVDYLRAKGEINVSRILTEALAGKYMADVILGKLRALIALKRPGLLAAYESPENKAFAEGFKDPEGYWTTIHISAYAVGYNTKLVKPQEVPKNYESLLDPKWKGKIGLDYYSYDWFTGLLEVMGHEKGSAYMERLSKQKLVLRAGGPLLAQLLGAGEFSLAILIPDQVESIRRKGASVEMAKFDFQAPTSLTSASILSKAPHPNAARLLYEYLLSKEAQEYIGTTIRIPARTGVKPDWINKEMKYYPLHETLLEGVTEKNMKEFDKIFKGGR